MPAKTSLIGLKFGRLNVLETAPSVRFPCGTVRTRSLCVCDCGAKLVAMNYALKSGHTKSCGCLQREKAAASNFKHGYARQAGKGKTYFTWRNMIERCNPNGHRMDSKHYSGRGITVCARWRSFENFLADMGEAPKGHTLGRKDNNGNYEPGNCEWQTQAEQTRNTRRNHIVTVDGITGCLTDVAHHFGFTCVQICNRLRRGWDMQKAFHTPLLSHRPARSKASISAAASSSQCPGPLLLRGEPPPGPGG